METVILVLAFTILVVLVYRFWTPVAEPPKRDVKANTATLYFFYTTWCGWSKKAMPEWQALEASLASNAVFGTTTVTAERVDAEEDVARTTLYEVDAYPTVVLETRTGLHRYSGKHTATALRAFLIETLGEPLGEPTTGL